MLHKLGDKATAVNSSLGKSLVLRPRLCPMCSCVQGAVTKHHGLSGFKERNSFLRVRRAESGIGEPALGNASWLRTPPFFLRPHLAGGKPASVALFLFKILNPVMTAPPPRPRLTSSLLTAPTSKGQYIGGLAGLAAYDFGGADTFSPREPILHRLLIAHQCSYRKILMFIHINTDKFIFK